MRALPLIIALITLMVMPSMASGTTIPINKDFMDGDMVIHVLQVNITDYPMGNVYSPDPSNTVWPKLVFTYENKGTGPVNGNLEVAFFDDKGNQYPPNGHLVDVTMDPLQPGKTSDIRFVEAAVIPRDTKISYFKVYINGKGEAVDIPYTEATATPLPEQGGGANKCCLAMLLPLMAIGVYMASKLK